MLFSISAVIECQNTRDFTLENRQRSRHFAILCHKNNTALTFSLHQWFPDAPDQLVNHIRCRPTFHETCHRYPSLEKANLDPDNLTNYRPISNLPFASKLLERHVARCLLDHVTANDLLDRNQSAYRPHHSTETALVLVQNDILKALDRRHGVILILLDMSAAFDTVDHDVLVTRLVQRFGVTGCAIAWIKSYLADRSQSVNINGGVSNDTPLAFGVPQGSALGPILFSIYTTPHSPGI